jgi:DNA-binding beta-propeller fold protein YncE
MAEVTRTVHVRVLTFDPAQGEMIPVPGATLLCEDSGFLWDPDLSRGTPVTDGDGRAQVELRFDETEEESLNPFFTITIPAASRAVPAGAPAGRQIQLPDEWVTRHYVNRRIPRISSFTDPSSPLELFVGLPAHLRIAYSDYDPSAVRNPFALPGDSARVYLADHDDFLWIDWLNPDDTLTGFGFDPRANRIVPAGEGDEYPYFDPWPTAPFAWDGAPAAPRAWIDPPGAPVGALGGPSFAATGPLAADGHGFVFMVDGDVVCRFYPDGTLCETIDGPGAGFSGPGGLALDQYRNLYVADSGNHRVEYFFLDETDHHSGRYRHAGGVGSHGSGNGAFDRPLGLAVVPDRVVDAPELLAVADAGNSRVQLFTIQLTPSGGRSHRASRSFTSPSPVFALAFGAPAVGAGQLLEPVGVAADARRRLFVCDRALHRVSRWSVDAAGTSATHEADWEKAGRGAGAGDGEFDTPVAIAVDARNGYVYVAEEGNRRVQRLDADSGAHRVHWAPTYTPALGSPFTPAGVAVDPRGELYAADGANARVVRGTVFDDAGAPLADGAAPQTVGAPWTPRAEAGHTGAPGYVALGPDGALWVSDTGNDRVLVFRRDAAGALVPAAAPPSAGLSRPVGIAFDGQGNLFVVDSGNGIVHRFDPALAAQGSLGAPGAGDDQLSDPRGIAIAQRTEPELYVADRGNNRVQVLRRDNTFIARLTTDGTRSLDAPEDVALDATGAVVYVADTGNGRIAVFRHAADGSHAFERAVPMPRRNLPTGASPSPCGVSLDPDGKLIVTDRAQDAVFRLEPDGTLLAYWDLKALAQLSARHSTADRPAFFYPELARQLVLDAPSRAVVDGRGLLAIADTGHDRIRLVRVHTDIAVNLFDLGEGLPDISLRAVTKADWTDELGLEVNVGDVSIFDDSHDFVSEPEADFARDRYDRYHLLGATRGTNSAINVLKVVREVQSWYKHHTRADEAAGRWGVGSRTLDVDLFASDNSYTFLDVNMGEESPDGRRSDAWDDSVVAHEMTHWVFWKAIQPYPPFSLVGLIRLAGGHSLDAILSPNQALNEGWPNYVEAFWGAEGGSTDRVRGYGMSHGTALTSIVARSSGALRQHLFGGPASAPLPSFADPDRAQQSEGYFANALYQLHRALTDPEVLFADAPSYWHRFNVDVSEEQSKRYADTIWKTLRLFDADPPDADLDQGSRVYLRKLLGQFRSAQPAFAELAQSIFELNNLLMPTITISEGTSDTARGTPVGEELAVALGEARSLIVDVRDATGAPLRGYNLRIAVPDAGRYSVRAGVGPTVRHGTGPSAAPAATPPAADLFRATNASGIVNLTVQAAAAAGTETLTVSYQPDFDADATFSPPEKGDDRETTLRRLYLYELRAAAKTWAGVGANRGAIVSRSLRLNARPA